VRKDIVVAIVAVLIIAAVTFGLAKMRPDLPATPSSPAGAEKSDSEAAKKSGKVVMRVNGDPVTQAEFEAFMSAVPEQQRAAFAGPAGRRELANELVRMKALEQEAKRRGLDKDPELRSQLNLLTTQLVATKALQSIVEERSEKQIQSLYEKEKGSSLSLRHIVVAYEGGMVPPRQGKAPSGEEAMRKAGALAQRIRGGADFAATARAESDDAESGRRGGSLGPLRAEVLPPEIAKVVTTLKPGQISDPVKTQFGIHIFSVGAPTLEDMRPMLQQRVQTEIAQEEVKKLQAAAKVDLDPQFFPPAPVVPTPGAQPSTAPPTAPPGGG
jgi:parvulin-like peptidyl-prolyl isomerase